MKRLSLILFMLTPFIVVTPLHAVTYPFPEKEPSQFEEELVLKVGTKVYLFHSEAEEVKNTIKVNDVLSVYREYPPDLPGGPREVGKIRILSVKGEHYFVGEVIAGEAKAGYLAKKGTVSCIVTSYKVLNNH